MRALFVQQDHASPVGSVGARFGELGYDVEELLVVPQERYHEPAVTITFPDPRDYDVIVPMGAVWSVYDEESIGSWVRDELAFLRAAHESSVPVFGICFGAQALAAALGGRVEPAPEPEIGWYEIASDDPGLVEPGPWFQWHSDRFIAPPHARVLARTPRAPQVFTSGRSMGVQFHPELDAAMLRGWLDNGGAEHLEARGIDAAALLDRTAREAPAAAGRAARLVDRFLERVAEPAASRYARTASVRGDGEHTLEATESAVAERLIGLPVDMSALAVVSNIYRAANAIRNRVERTVLAPHGLTWTGWVVLWVIWIWEDIESRHVAAEAGISKGTLTGVAGTLASHGLVSRRVHPRDARRVLLSLTPQGQALMVELFPEFNAAEAAVTADLSAQDQQVVARALRSVVRRAET